MIALDQEREIMPDDRISIEYSGTNTGITKIAFWGVLRYLIREASSSDQAECLIGYPTTEQSKKRAKPDAAELVMMPDPVRRYAMMPRLQCGPNQNIMVPEFLLGNQATPETPAGFEDESFTFLSDSIAVTPNGRNYGFVVIVPGADDVVVKQIAGYVSYEGNVTLAIPTVAVRLPNGYSLTGGDMVPLNLLPGGAAVFPTLRLRAGDRVIVDVSNMLPNASTGLVFLVLQFDGVKRRKRVAA